MGTGIKRVQTAFVVLILAVFGFLGTQPAVATDVFPSPQPSSESPAPEPSESEEPPPVVVIPPIDLPTSSPAPLEPTPAEPAPVQPPAPPAPPPVAPPAVEPVTPATTEPVVTPQPSLQVLPTDVPVQEYVVEPGAPTETASAAAVVTPSPSPTKSAAPAVASADITGPLKAALAPVAENNPIVQGLTVLVLLLLGLAYFRALRSKGIRRPRLNGK